MRIIREKLEITDEDKLFAAVIRVGKFKSAEEMAAKVGIPVEYARARWQRVMSNKEGTQ